MVAFFTDDVVLIGDTEENFDRATTVAYLQLMADMTPTESVGNGTVWRWCWTRPGLLSFAAAGSMGFYDPAGQLMGEAQPFRVTCLGVEEQGEWRLKHFHGSRPRLED